jgi:RNA polymerase sigma-70 factor, ECF subfamily
MNNELENLWNQFHGRLSAFIRSRVSDPDEADDILQEVFIRIHTHLDTIRDLERLESWIYQIARNSIIDSYRRKHPAAPLPETLASERPPDEDVEADVALYIKEAVDTLPEPYRQALLLVEYDGLSQIELANRLGITSSGAKSRVQRARQKVRDLILACCHLEFDAHGTIVEVRKRCCCCSDELLPI